MCCRCVLCAFLFALVGCGGSYDGASSLEYTSAPEAMSGEEGAPAEEVQADENTSGELSDRKIIYTASIDLVVEDFAQTEQQVTGLVSDLGGYVAEFREDRRYGGQLGGQWVVRVPVVKFDEFVQEVLDLGVPMMRQIDAQDVTEQYIDLTARLENKRRLESRILQLLEDQTAAIKDVIEVETQLGRVREEIELFEGKLRYLTDRVTMTTITISAREERDHIPEQAPNLSAKIRKVFSSSLETLRQAAEGLLLVVIAAVPWLIVALIGLAPVWLLLRRRRRR